MERGEMEFDYVRGTWDWTHKILVVLANGGGKVGRGLGCC